MINLIMSVFGVLLVVFGVLPTGISFNGSTYIVVLSGYLLLMFSFLLRIKVNTFIYLFIILYTTLFPLVLNQYTVFNRYVSLNIGLIIVVSSYILQRSKMFFSSFVIVMSITSIFTFKALLSNPYACRLLKSSGDYSMYIRRHGVGGYEFIYSLIFILIVLFYILINNDAFRIKKRYKTLFSFCFLFGMAIVLMSQYLTALIIIYLSCVLLTVLKGKICINNIHKRIILFIIIIIITTGLMFSLLAASANFLIKDKNMKGVQRLESISSYFYGKSDALGNVDGRSLVLLKSVQSIKENFFFGTIFKSSSSLESIGQHSTMLDTFTFFGFFIGIVYSCCYIIPLVKDIIANKKTIFFSLYLVLFLAFSLLFVFNNLTISLPIVVFCIIPYIVNKLKNRGISHV